MPTGWAYGGVAGHAVGRRAVGRAWRLLRSVAWVPAAPPYPNGRMKWRPGGIGSDLDHIGVLVRPDGR